MTVTTLNCDQVAWIKDALDRRDYMKSPRFPRISRIAAMADSAFMLELCEILGVQLDENAKHNATPVELRLISGKNQETNQCATAIGNALAVGISSYESEKSYVGDVGKGR